MRHVVNYVDPLHRGYSEERDGHSHASALDQCRGGPESRTRRVAWAKEASADLLSAVAQHASNRDERLARVDDVLDRWLARVPGCDRSNRYCSAPELAEISSGCAAGGPGGPAGPDLALFAGLAVLLFARRRWPSVVIVALGSLLSTSVAAADDASATDERVRALALQPDVQEVVEVNRDEDEATVVSVEQRELSGGVAIERGLGVQAHAFGGMDKGVLGLGVGPRLDVIPWMIFGLDVEYASWISLATGDIARGVFNAAIVADFVYGKIGSVELRGHLALGCSVLLFDLAAADKGSTGPFAGFSILGIAIRASRSLRVVVEPAGLYFSVPQLRGFPLVHRHHRFMVALHYTP
ncbi:MAG: hypothetical protein H5U40_05145 [Polyangiaceae bacterium]|nr:hypothetical protein [Polyangiaceae bacterium]